MSPVYCKKICSFFCPHAHVCFFHQRQYVYLHTLLVEFHYLGNTNFPCSKLRQVMMRLQE